MSAIQMTPGLGQSQMSMPNMSAMKNMAATPAVWSFNYSVLMFYVVDNDDSDDATERFSNDTSANRANQTNKKTKSIIRQVTSFICGYLLAGQLSVFLLRHFSRSSSCVIGCLP